MSKINNNMKDENMKDTKVIQTRNVDYIGVGPIDTPTSSDKFYVCIHLCGDISDYFYFKTSEEANAFRGELLIQCQTREWIKLDVEGKIRRVPCPEKDTSY